MPVVIDILELEKIHGEAKEFTTKTLQNNQEILFEIIYDLKRENLKNQLIISKLTK